MTKAILLVGNSLNNKTMYYQTHFLAGDPFVYVKVDGRSILVVSLMEEGRARKESTVSEVRNFDEFGYKDMVQETNDRRRAFTGMLLRLLDELGVDQVQVEPDFPVMYADGLRAEGISLGVQPDLFILERRQKDPEEIEAIQSAQRATEGAMQRARDIIARSEDLAGVLHVDGIPLTSERLRTEMELALLRDGLETEAIIVAGGPTAADPHSTGSGPLKTGESIIIDIFPRGKGSRYFADMTRTFVKGEPSETLRKMYDAASDALDAALSELKPGANGRTAHEAALAALKKAGFQEDTGPRMTHGTGHGVGLDIHEGPVIGKLDVELVVGDVITVEPGLYDPDIGGVRIEDIVVITADGYRNLTNFPREFEL